MGLNTLTDSEINSSLTPTPTPESAAAVLNMTKLSPTSDLSNKANNSKRKGRSHQHNFNFNSPHHMNMNMNMNMNMPVSITTGSITTNSSSTTTTTPTKGQNHQNINAGGKPLGTRSVSTLTPSQLARKRANDREAQRAIRARTKEHIESLERQVEDLRGQQGRDRVVQELLRRNKVLEDELRRLRDNLGLPTTGSQHHGSLYPQSATSAAAAAAAAAYPGQQATCTRTPPFSAPDYQQAMQQQQHDGIPAYNNIHDTTSEAWHQASLQSSIGSADSSPSSRGGTTAEDGTFGSHNFITGAATMPASSAMDAVMSSPAPSSIGMKAGGGGAFDDIKSGGSNGTAAGGEMPHHFTLTTGGANGRSAADFGVMPTMAPSFHTAQQSWNMYNMYYPGSPATAAM